MIRRAETLLIRFTMGRSTSLGTSRYVVYIDGYKPVSVIDPPERAPRAASATDYYRQLSASGWYLHVMY